MATSVALTSCLESVLWEFKSNHSRAVNGQYGRLCIQRSSAFDGRANPEIAVIHFSVRKDRTGHRPLHLLGRAS